MIYTKLWNEFDKEHAPFFGRNDAKAEAPVLWAPHAKSWLIGKDSDAGRDWGAGGEGDDRGWDGWMASPTRWKWVWVNSGSWWWTGRPGVLRFMGSQRTELTELNWCAFRFLSLPLPALQWQCWAGTQPKEQTGRQRFKLFSTLSQVSWSSPANIVLSLHG